MTIVRCPICGDIITEEDIVARDDKGNFTFRHCGKYWHVMKDAVRTTDREYIYSTNADHFAQSDWNTVSQNYYTDSA